MAFGTSTLSDIGNPEHQSALSISDTEQGYTLPAKYKTLEIYNADPANLIYYGAAGVASSTGIPIFPGQSKVFHGVNHGFTVHLVCATGKTATAQLVIYKGV